MGVWEERGVGGAKASAASRLFLIQCSEHLRTQRLLRHNDNFLTVLPRFVKRFVAAVTNPDASATRCISHLRIAVAIVVRSLWPKVVVRELLHLEKRQHEGLERLVAPVQLIEQLGGVCERAADRVRVGCGVACDAVGWTDRHPFDSSVCSPLNIVCMSYASRACGSRAGACPIRCQC